MNNILNKIAQMERNAEEIKLASNKVELATTFNDAVDGFKFYVKMYDESLARVKSLQDKLSGDMNMAKQNEVDLQRIKKSLIDLGFNQDAAELDKLLSQKLISKFEKLYNSVKSF
jgi:hypothetical protein